MPLERLARIVGKVEGTQEMLLAEFREHRAAARQASTEIKTEVHEIKVRVTRLEDRRCKPPVSERVIKQMLTFGIPAGTLIYTGSVQKALEVLQLLR